MHVLPVEKIDYLESQDDYVAVRCGGRSYLKEQPLGDLEAQLDPTVFVRIHRRYVLNLARLAKIEMGVTDSRIAILRDGTQLPISRTGTRGYENFCKGEGKGEAGQKKSQEREFLPAALGSKFCLRSWLCLLAAGRHRRAPAIFTLQVDDRQTLGSPDDSRGQHPAPRTNHTDCCIGSSCHTLAPNPFRRLSASNGSTYAFPIGKTGLAPSCVGK